MVEQEAIEIPDFQIGMVLKLKVKIDPDYEEYAYNDTVRLFSDDGTYENILTVRDGEELEDGISTLTFNGVILGKTYSVEVDQGEYEYGADKYFLFKDHPIVAEGETLAREIELETVYPTIKFRENGEAAKWLFIYLDLPRTEGFRLEFAFVTDENGRLGALEIPERSAILERGEVYNLFYDFRPWTEEELATLTDEDCQEVTIGDEILLDSKSGDIEVVLEKPTGEPLANFPYKLHLPDGSVRDGMTDDSGVLSELDLPGGIINLEITAYEEPSEEELLQEEESLEEESFRRDMDALEEEEGADVDNYLTDDVFLVKIGWLRGGEVCLCRGRRYTISILHSKDIPWNFEFKHWKLFGTLSKL